MPDTFVGAFADRMNQNSRMNVKLAQEGDILRNGWIYVAPGGVHMELEKSSPRHVRVRFDDGAKVNFVKPAVDVTLFSAARIFKNRVISVVLTGMGSDGREGTRIVKKLGGQSIALKEEESIIYGMNKSVIDAGLADHILGMDGIVKQLAKMVYSAKTTKVNN
jgi:two-component system chemotaxis response regulator CheB